MTYEMYRYVFLGCAIACGVMAAVSVILFFYLRIPHVIGDLTGRTARKAIEDIRKQNERSGNKTYRSSAVNLQRGKLTDKITRSGRLTEQGETPFGTGIITEKISTRRLPVASADETTVLTADNETTLLEPGSAMELPQMDSGQTAVLQRQEEPEALFVIEYEITYIHTNEVIAL